MPTANRKRKFNPQQVLGDIAALSNAQFERLMPQVFALRSVRGRSGLPKRESKLLEDIRRALPGELQIEFNRLVEKRRVGTLSPAEERRLHRLIDKVELHDAHRLRCLVHLAGLRGTTVDQLMRRLGLKTPAYA